MFWQSQTHHPSTSPPRSLRSEREVPESWSHQLAEGHGSLRLVLEDVGVGVTVLLDRADEATALRSLQGVAGRIAEEIVPHERTDQSQVYPVVAEYLGGDDPLAPMSRTHQEIFHLSSLLSRLVDDATEHGFDPADRGEARRILYSLDAILRLHRSPQGGESLSSLAVHGAENSRTTLIGRVTTRSTSMSGYSVAPRAPGEHDRDLMAIRGDVSSLHDSEGVREVQVSESAGEEEQGGCDDSDDRSDREPEGAHRGVLSSSFLDGDPDRVERDQQCEGHHRCRSDEEEAQELTELQDRILGTRTRGGTGPVRQGPKSLPGPNPWP